MKATEAKLLEFLKKTPQCIIPIYQRTYSWTEREIVLSRDRHGSGVGSAVYLWCSPVYVGPTR